MLRKYFPFCFYVLVSVLCLGKPSLAYPAGSLGGGGVIPTTLTTETDSITPLKIGDKIPDELWQAGLSVVSADNEQQQTIRLGDYRDKLIILDFWSSWCGPCVRSTPNLDTLQKRYKKDLLILLITDDSEQRLSKFWNTNKYAAGTNLKHVINSNLSEYFPHKLIPYTIFIDSDGIIKDMTTGMKVTEETPFLNELIAQNRTQYRLTGAVLDGLGEPLEDATVSYQGITLETDETGRFSLAVTDVKGTIVISHLGYETEYFDFNLTERDFVSIALAHSSTLLESVEISTGYQTIPKVRATGAFSTIGKDRLGEQLGFNILDRMEGLVSGVQFDHAGQRPKITVRGISSLNASKNPLIVVDNFPYQGDINDLNPEDIEDITILKDAAASSIWGARAGNGVIVIRTKRGRDQKGLRIGVSSGLQIVDQPDVFKSDNFMQIDDFIEVEQMLFDNGYYDALLNNIRTYPVVSPVVELLERNRSGLISDSEVQATLDRLKNQDVRKDIEKHLYQKGVNQHYSMNLSGGTDKHTYYLSSGYYRDINHLARKNDRFTARMHNSFRLHERLNLGVSIDYSYNRNVDGRTDFTSIKHDRTKRLLPYLMLIDEQGNPLPVVNTFRESYVDTAGQGKLLDWRYYPLVDDDFIDQSTTRQSIINTVNLKYNISNDLSLAADYQYSRQNSEFKKLFTENSFYARDQINRFSQVNWTTGEVVYPLPRGSILDANNGLQTAYSLRGQLTYGKEWTDQSFHAIAGGEIREAKFTQSGGRTYGYNEDLGYANDVIDFVKRHPLYYYGSAFIVGGDTFHGTIDRYISYYANAAYNYKKRYSLTGSIRKDMSNLFGVKTNNKGRPFWSIGGAWEISKEPFYKNDLITYLKLRSTFGYSGNVDNSMSAYTAMLYMGQDGYTGFPIAYVNEFANPELRWEKNRIVNLGLDFNIVNHIIGGSIDVYHKKGTDLLGDSPLDITTGLRSKSIRKNVASLKGKGIDVLLNTRQFRGSFKWYSTLMFNYNENEVDKYYLTTTRGSNYINPGYLITPIEGKSAYSILSYQWAGLDPETGEPRGYDKEGNVSKDYSYLMGTDTEVGDLIYAGSATPLYFGSIGNRLQYKGFSLAVNVIYKAGFYFRKSSINYHSLSSGWVQHPDFAERWRVPGDEEFTDVPALTYPIISTSNSFYLNSDVLVRRGDHIRLQYIDLGYDFSQSKILRDTFSKLQVYVNLSNIGFIWRANKDGVDPETLSTVPRPMIASIGFKLDM